ncbi:MAG: hypothetical protein ACYCOX_17770 [Acidobacteriaceae bacterium]
MKTERSLRMEHAVMSFEEIAAALGISCSGAKMLYGRAIRKLRKRPQSLAKLLALAAELDKTRRSEIE